MYSIKKVSELLDIPAVTIRAWENRYQIVCPVRTEGGHRLYNNQDVETLRWLKKQVNEKNMKISDAVRLHAEQKKPISEFQAPNRHYEEIMERLYYALLDFDSVRANELTNLAFSLYDYEEVFKDILAGILYRIGDEWEKGSVSVAQEHFSSEFILQRCTQFLRILPVQTDLPKVLAFTPSGEHHHIGLMLFSLFLRKKGHDVIYLGPNTPLDPILDIVKKREISILAISITDPALLPGMEKWVERCRKENPGLKIIIGGSSIREEKELQYGPIFYSKESNWEDWYKSLNGLVLKSY